MLYNTDLYLWENASKLPSHKHLTVKDGFVIHATGGTIGSFKTSDDALSTLEKAGYAAVPVSHNSYSLTSTNTP